MIVIPAIDVREGRCVRLRQGRLEDETVYSMSPEEAACHWAALGAPLLHVVDLDGAIAGEPRNQALVERVLKAATIPVQVGGGIRTHRTIETYLALGASRVVLGTAAVMDCSLVSEVCRRFPDRVVASLDAVDGRVAVRGWREYRDEGLIELARRLAGEGLAALIHTAIERDGMLRGPNVSAVRNVVAAVPLPVIASGGISRLDDLQALAGTGVSGAIIGRALYEGTVELPAALAVAAQLAVRGGA